ncbi:MAG: 4'-phosphopantetheinyl transferase superfamily protein [Prevotella sp.]|jgi:phosphopantetheinyl transferase
MPVVRDEFCREDVRLCVWQITETVDELPHPLHIDLSDVHSVARKREILAVYALLAYVTGRNDLIIEHDETGKPHVQGWQLSISHTKGWAALILSKQRCVAVDIEYISDRVGRVTHRFMRPDERADNLSQQLINWSAKETVYKLLSAENLQYFEMRLKPFKPLSKGRLEVEDLKEAKSVIVDFELNKYYVLTYASLDNREDKG